MSKIKRLAEELFGDSWPEALEDINDGRQAYQDRRRGSQNLRQGAKRPSTVCGEILQSENQGAGSMSWRDDPATITQQLALRNALDHRYGMLQGGEIYREITKDGITKGQASDELRRLYEKEKK